MERELAGHLLSLFYKYLLGGNFLRGSRLQFLCCMRADCSFCMLELAPSNAWCEQQNEQFLLLAAAG